VGLATMSTIRATVPYILQAVVLSVVRCVWLELMHLFMPIIVQGEGAIRRPAYPKVSQVSRGLTVIFY
jgi:hypothetical protein